MSQRRVVCAALKFKDYIVIGPRHYDQTMVDTIVSLKINEDEQSVQGFIDQHGIFMTRKVAFTVAKEADQIIRRCGGDNETLYSENLY